MINYTLSKKSLKWYIHYCDYEGKKHQKLLKNCKTAEEAKKCALKFSVLEDDQYLIKNISKDMYIPGGQHLERLAMLGKTFADETVCQKRMQIEIIIRQFGDFDIRNLKVRDVELFLMKDKTHSGSWKNNIIDTFSTVYDETIWKCDVQVKRPHFQRFSRNSRKADIFTMQELDIILNPEVWKMYDDFLAFYIIAACGLRIGEARALRVSQIFWTEKVLLINGFCKEDGLRTDYNKKGSEENKKIRVAPLSDKLLAMLKNYIEMNHRQENDFLFYNDTGTKPVTKEHLESQLRHVLKRTGIYNPMRKLVPHSFRFTYVTYMRSLLEGEQVRLIVGHSDMDMTNYYTRFSLHNEIRGIKDSFSAVNKIF